MMHLALFVIGKSVTTKDFKKNVLIWNALISKISRGAHRLNRFWFVIISYHISSDNHELLASRNITQEQALDYFHGTTPPQNSLATSNRQKCNAASAITPEGNVVKGAVVIVEMWKRLPFFHYVAPMFEGGLGSKVLSSGAPPNTWLMGCCRFDPIMQPTIIGHLGASL